MSVHQLSKEFVAVVPGPFAIAMKFSGICRDNSWVGTAKDGVRGEIKDEASMIAYSAVLGKETCIFHFNSRHSIHAVDCPFSSSGKCWRKSSVGRREALFFHQYDVLL